MKLPSVRWEELAEDSGWAMEARTQVAAGPGARPQSPIWNQDPDFPPEVTEKTECISFVPAVSCCKNDAAQARRAPSGALPPLQGQPLPRSRPRPAHGD